MSRRPLCRALILLCLAASPGAAQQTIINMPSADQTPKGRFFYLHESVVRQWGGQDFYQTTNFLTYGLTDRVELALTTYNFGSPWPTNSAVGVGWKTAQPLAPSRTARWELTATAGQMLPVNVDNGRVGVWSYGHLSTRIPGLGLRLAGGLSWGPTALMKQNTLHFIGSFEQPLTRSINLLGEWWSGSHEYADFVPGLNWHTDRFVVIVGYKFSNKPGNATDGLIIEVGSYFGRGGAEEDAHGADGRH